MTSNAFFLPVFETPWGKLSAVSLLGEKISFVALSATILICNLAEWNFRTWIAVVVVQSEVSFTTSTLSVTVIVGTPWNWDNTNTIEKSKTLTTNQALVLLLQDTPIDFITVTVRVQRIKTTTAL